MGTDHTLLCINCEESILCGRNDRLIDILNLNCFIIKHASVPEEEHLLYFNATDDIGDPRDKKTFSINDFKKEDPSTYEKLYEYHLKYRLNGYVYIRILERLLEIDSDKVEIYLIIDDYRVLKRMEMPAFSFSNPLGSLKFKNKIFPVYYSQEWTSYILHQNLKYYLYPETQEVKCTITGKCSHCDFIHNNTETTMLVDSRLLFSTGKAEGFARCINCNLPWKKIINVSH